MINFDDFKKIEITIGKILSAEKVPETDKLLRLTVDFKEETPRQIVSGIAMHFPNPESLVGKKCAFVTNLEPRTIRGLESQGMILAVSAADFNNPDQTPFSLLTVSEDIPEGTKAK
jgi:methionyl-tRNA synthetase